MRRSWKPRLVACDLDGTLLRSDFTVSAFTVRVLKRLAAEHIPFVIATGRPVGTWLPVLDRIPRASAVVCANGAQVLDGAGGEVLAEWPIPKRDIHAAIDGLDRALPDAAFAVEVGATLRHEHRFVPVTWSPDRLTAAGDRASLFADEPLMLRVQSRNAELVHMAEHGLNFLVSSPTTAEATRRDVNKVTGVSWLASNWQISSGEILAFGDFTNDIELLSWAGVGVAPADASPDAKAVASDETYSSDDDGVARYIEAVMWP